MQRVTTAVALLAIVVANVACAPSMWRRMQRRGESYTTRDVVAMSAMLVVLLTGAAAVLWVLLNLHP